MKAREIKFRAWDSFRKEMLYCDGNHYWAFFDDPISIGYGLYHRNDNHRILSGEHNPPIMQFTGLYDKFEKEIFEGDIVKHWEIDGWDKEANKAILSPTEDISSIEYSGHGFWVKKEFFGWEGEGLWNWDRLEVVGNIYEHPHLLPNDIQNNGASQGTMPIEQNDDKQNNL